jgi:hypothetical protein
MWINYLIIQDIKWELDKYGFEKEYYVRLISIIIALSYVLSYPHRLYSRPWDSIAWSIVGAEANLGRSSSGSSVGIRSEASSSLQWMTNWFFSCVTGFSINDSLSNCDSSSDGVGSSSYCSWSSCWSRDIASAAIRFTLWGPFSVRNSDNWWGTRDGGSISEWVVWTLSHVGESSTGETGKGASTVKFFYLLDTSLG